MVGRAPARRGRPTARGRRRRGAGRGACRAHTSAPTARPPTRWRPRTPTPGARTARAGRRRGACRTRRRSAPGRRSTAPRAGSSTWSSSGPAPATRRRTSARWSRTPSASACASSRRAPWSASTLSPRGRSTVAARVQGPVDLDLQVPGVALQRLLEHVEVLGRAGCGPDAGRRPGAAAGQPPARGLEVGAEPRPDDRDDASARPVIERGGPRVRGARAGAAGRAARRRRSARPRPGRCPAGSRHRWRGSSRGSRQARPATVGRRWRR